MESVTRCGYSTPRGVQFHDGALFIADTCNKKVKKISPATREATRFLGSGEPGHREGVADLARFHEPSGLSVTDGVLYIVDTKNYAIRVANLQSHHVASPAGC
jgi:hypothetical protein